MMDYRIFTPKDRMEQLITTNYRLLNMLSRFGISLGVGDKSIEEVCKLNGVDCNTFLAVVNLCNNPDSPQENVEFSMEDLILYLKKSHTYYLDYKLPAIRVALEKAIVGGGKEMQYLILNYFDDAQNAFVAAYRKYDKGEDFHINIEYASTPDLTDKILILADTMLATGASLEIAYKRLCEEGEPAHTHLVCPISSAYAVEYLQKHLPAEGVTLWVAAIDEELTSHSYIVPGLGDAGDLAYGVKK